MPNYLDVHRNMKGSSLEDVSKAHAKDVEIQDKRGVKFLKYWFDEDTGTAFCLSTAPNKEAILMTHGECHGLVPQETYEVAEGS